MISTPRPVLIFVFVTILIDAMGFGLIMPVLPRLLMRVGDLSLDGAISLSVWMSLAMALAAFVSAPILGNLSDRFGRRPVLLVSLLGSALGYVLFGIAGSLGMLFASRIIDGISGGNISTAQAVIADITGPEDRAKGMGLIGAAFGLGFILGPAIGALLVTVAPWLPGIAAATASLIAFLLVLTRLPETLDPEAKSEARRRPLNLRSLAEALSFPLVGFCLVMVFFTIFAFANFETTFAQFAKPLQVCVKAASKFKQMIELRITSRDRPGVNGDLFVQRNPAGGELGLDFF